MDARGTIGLTEEQAQLLEVAESFCRDKSPIDKVRGLLTEDIGYDVATWREIVDLGWLAMSIPEEYDGVGLSLAEVVPVVEQMGHRMLASPFVSTTLAAQAILVGGTAEQKQKLLPKIAGGAQATLALCEGNGDWDLTHIDAIAEKTRDFIVLRGSKTLVTDAEASDFIIASVIWEEKPQLAIIDRDKIDDSAFRRESIIDETKRSFEVSLDGIKLSQSDLMDVSAVQKTLDHIHLAAGLLTAAEMVGATRATIDYTVEYLQTRKQFGKIIGSYQALKHPVVDAHVMYEQARSHLYSAAHNFDNQGEGEIATRMAKAQAGDAFSFASDRAIQFHGGFGFTYDCDAQLYRRKSIWCENMYGDAIYHRAKLAELLL